MKKSIVRKLLLLPLMGIALPAGFANAQTSAYYYGGVCGNQGNWTGQALARTNELRTFIKQVKDDENCKLLPQTMQETFSAMEAQIKQLQQNGSVEKQTSLKQEIGALRTFMGSDANFRQQVSNLMTQKMVQHGADQAAPGTLMSPIGAAAAVATGGNPAAVALSLTDLQKRARETFSQSMTLIDKTVDTLPQVQSCLVDPNHFGHFLASTIQLIGSFASSNQDPTGSQLARTISKLSTYSRDYKFGNALSRIEQNQLMASLSCIIEVTSESYCAARDGKIIFDEMMANSMLETDNKGELRLKAMKVDYKSAAGGQHPLEGYYIMTQNVPLITQWLQNIQIGVDPRLPTDSAQKNKPLDEINNFYKTLNELRAAFNFSMETLREMKTAEEKRNQVLKLTLALTGQMTGGFLSNPADTNFFTLRTQAMHLPFLLIGIPTPDPVLGTGGAFQQPPAAWLEANYLKLQEFNDPEALAIRIGENMNRLIREAELSAITYYNKWFIVDKVAIVNRALIGTLYNAKESLREVDAYLERLENRVQQHAEDKSIMVGLRDTRIRIRKVLARFEILREASRNVTGDLENDPAALSVAEDLVTEVMNQFYVMLGKSGWLATRMIDFVHYDYNLMQRSGFNMSPYLQEVLLATGRPLIDDIIQMSSGNPVALNQDLAMALRLNKGNLEALEAALSGAYVDQIALLDHIVTGKKAVNGASMWATKNRDSIYWTADEIPGQWNNKVWLHAKAFWKTVLGEFPNVGYIYGQASETFGWIVPTRLSPDDEFGSAKRVKNQLCVQSLGFNNLKPLWQLCKDSTLESPFVKSSHLGVNEESLAKLNVNFKDKAWEGYKEDIAKNHSKRICAMRDFSRKNLVLYLLQGQTRH